MNFATAIMVLAGGVAIYAVVKLQKTDAQLAAGSYNPANSVGYDSGGGNDQNDLTGWITGIAGQLFGSSGEGSGYLEQQMPINPYSNASAGGGDTFVDWID